MAEKYGSRSRPVFSFIASSYPSARKRSQHSDVLRHCHTIALYIGRPVFLSHTTVVSLWFVIPIPYTSDHHPPIFKSASVATAICVDHIVIGSCSTQPSFGNICANSRWTILAILPFFSNRIHLELVVPWSSAIIYFFIPYCNR